MTALKAPARRRERLARARRLRKRGDFLAVQERGRRVSGQRYVAYALERVSGSGTRFGVTVSRKVGGAVVRNVVKRWLRESYRRMQDLELADVDLVIIARPAAAAAGLDATAKEVRTLLDRLARA